MIMMKHELRQGRKAFLIWTAAIGFLLVVCVFLFPEMKGQMEEINDAFSSMGSFTVAFGMDQLNFGTLKGYYAIECGNVLGMGGAFFASLCAAGMLSKEEKEKTADFLLTHPVSRRRIVSEKLLALLWQVTILHLIIYGLSAVSMLMVGENVPWKEMSLLHLAYYLLQLEMTGICFGISAFMKRGSIGTGLGLAALMYALNLMANITDSAAFLKYITPFGYCDGTVIVNDGVLEAKKVLIGMLFGVVGIVTAYWRYERKDLQA